ncbi:hypothetical protein HK104_007517 [Borealophlyctis nickersoniae]|nr:hypothetical protein HK104_007517 [Borealophlyctis nickersoniae]
MAPQWSPRSAVAPYIKRKPAHRPPVVLPTREFQKKKEFLSQPFESRGNDDQLVQELTRRQEENRKKNRNKWNKTLKRRKRKMGKQEQQEAQKAQQKDDQENTMDEHEKKMKIHEKRMDEQVKQKDERNHQNMVLPTLSLSVPGWQRQLRDIITRGKRGVECADQPLEDGGSPLHIRFDEGEADGIVVPGFQGGHGGMLVSSDATYLVPGTIRSVERLEDSVVDLLQDTQSPTVHSDVDATDCKTAVEEPVLTASTSASECAMICDGDDGHKAASGTGEDKEWPDRNMATCDAGVPTVDVGKYVRGIHVLLEFILRLRLLQTPRAMQSVREQVDFRGWGTTGKKLCHFGKATSDVREADQYPTVYYKDLDNCGRRVSSSFHDASVGRAGRKKAPNSDNKAALCANCGEKLYQTPVQSRDNHAIERDFECANQMETAFAARKRSASPEASTTAAKRPRYLELVWRARQNLVDSGAGFVANDNVADESTTTLGWNGKPPGTFGNPVVWCEYRQELAEGYASDKRYIQYQSGVQINEIDECSGKVKIVTGVLIGGSHNDCTSKTQDGSIHLKESQSESDRHVKALTETMKRGLNVMIIMSKSHPASNMMPRRAGYVVLAYYRITHKWYEKEDGGVRIKFRYENSIEFNLPIQPLRAIKRMPEMKDELFRCISVNPASRVKVYLTVDTSGSRYDGFLKVIYAFPKGGEVHHILNGKGLDDAVDQLYLDMQRARLPFRRFPVKARVQGQLTSCYVLNAGEKYVQASVLPARPVHEVAQIEREALSLLQSAVKEFGTEFNQCHKNLTLSGDGGVKKMNWHDDGEKQVYGPVSCLSLGSDCDFRFRTKPKMVGAKVKKGTGTQVLRLRLAHGDMLIMIGKHIQRDYQHMAAPQGHRISITARTIINDDTNITATQRTALVDLESKYETPREHPHAAVLQDESTDMKSVSWDLAIKLAAEGAGRDIPSVKIEW